MDYRKKYGEEVGDLLQELMGVNAPAPSHQEKGKEQQTAIHYQLPVQIGKAGLPLESGDKPWVVGTFLPNQYVNDTHPQGHMGIDLKAPKGTPVYPIGPGIVINTASNPKGGLAIKIAHEDGHVVSYYAHLSQISVSKDQQVALDTVIGAVGDTGNAKGRGAHLHYEVSVNGSKIDPSSITGRMLGSLSQVKQAQIYLKLIKILQEIKHS